MKVENHDHVTSSPNKKIVLVSRVKGEKRMLPFFSQSQLKKPTYNERNSVGQIPQPNATVFVLRSSFPQLQPLRFKPAS